MSLAAHCLRHARGGVNLAVLRFCRSQQQPRPFARLHTWALVTIRDASTLAVTRTSNIPQSRPLLCMRHAGLRSRLAKHTRARRSEAWVASS